MVRCFIACFLDSASASRLRGACPDFAGVRWTPTENYHVTLRFLGNVADTEIPALRAVVDDLDAHPCVCRVDGWRGLPSARRARVAAAVLAPNASLTSWYTEIRARCKVDDERPLMPHITVARAQRPIKISDQTPISELKVTLGEPTLYRSQTLPTGARYDRID